ncbi:uncharacterized protein LOC100899794 [Galendromus occidentalis]|uniref:Uncharacterized protein LOC100899794 n=1 Tax=Galendromus occidentalis TaxID=34638 RepID=A0AAJ6QUN0_9ACAR|nr:uncharacterized protein LOC100899794 [Galendromus occidentalis]
MFTVFPQRMVVDLKDIKDSSAGNTSPMDELVSAIRENLKLKAPVSLTGVCRSCTSRTSRRVSPYSIPSKENRRDQCSCRRVSSPRNQSEQEDPYELLQVLLKQGTLISEAVRRLQDPKRRGTKNSQILGSPPSNDSCVSCDSNSAPVAASTTTAAKKTTSNGKFLACAAT